MIQFISLSSGSNGNCYYLGNEETALLIDVGIGGRTIKKRLEDNGLSISKVEMILVTHNHIDHIKYLGSVAEKLSVPFYDKEIISIPKRRLKEIKAIYEAYILKQKNRL